MEAKEIAIKLFKLKAKEKLPCQGILGSKFLNGFNWFEEGDTLCYVGIDKASIYFNTLQFSLNIDEFNELNTLFQNLDNEQKMILEEKRKKKEILELNLMASVASKTNLNISRRVLIEKKMNITNFKF